jgi:uncharacterized protein YjiS (DUF1127 family)
MRFEEPASVLPAHFPASRAYGARPFVPFVTHEEITEGVARGRRLHAQFCRRAANAVIVRPILASARFVVRLVGATRSKLQERRAFQSTVRVLSGMADDQLRDIGISRSDILHVARTMVYTKRRSPSATIVQSATENWLEHRRAA